MDAGVATAALPERKDGEGRADVDVDASVAAAMRPERKDSSEQADINVNAGIAVAARPEWASGRRRQCRRSNGSAF